MFDAVYDYLETLGPIHVEPVSVGIFLKAGSFVELRPMTKWVAMSFRSAGRIEHAAIARKPIDTGLTRYHFVNLRSPDDLTDDVKAWLAESYELVD